MGFRLPIVASDIPSNRELCEEAALYFDADDETGCANCILRVLKDRAQANALIQRGAGNLRSFDWSWQRYAREFTGIIERATERKAA